MDWGNKTTMPHKSDVTTHLNNARLAKFLKWCSGANTSLAGPNVTDGRKSAAVLWVSNYAAPVPAFPRHPRAAE